MKKNVQIKEENKNTNSANNDSDKKNPKHSKRSLFSYHLAGWVAFIATCCSILCAHITVKNARYKLNVMGYVTECWSFEDDCINFDLRRSASLTLRLIGVQLILHTQIHARASSSIYLKPWMRVLFLSNSRYTDTAQANRLHSFKALSSHSPWLYHSMKPVYFCVYVVCSLANYNYQYNYLVPLCCAP